MRVCAHRARVTLRLIVTAAVVVLVMMLPHVQATASHCGGSGSVDDDGGQVVGECHSEDPSRSGYAGCPSVVTPDVQYETDRRLRQATPDAESVDSVRGIDLVTRVHRAESPV